MTSQEMFLKNPQISTEFALYALDHPEPYVKVKRMTVSRLERLSLEVARTF